MSSHLPTDIAAEFYIDGVWTSTVSGTSLVSRVRGVDEQAIAINRGIADQQGSISAQTASFQLNNRDGLFNDDNANSPLYGKFGQNTRARLGVQSGGTWQEYLRTPEYAVGLLVSPAQVAYTVDKASLDITGDIDIRVEYSPNYTRGKEMVLISKWNTTGNQRSWALYTRPEGGFRLWTSPDGTVGAALANTTVPVIAENTTRLAVRVTLDVNDGAGNKVYTYYTAPSIAGPWVSFASGTIAGTTSIFSSTANLEVGTADGGGTGFTTSYRFSGKIHAAEVYSGIAGTLVADFKPNGKGIETLTWADTCASPNTWIISGARMRLASDRVRVCGELIGQPLTWDKTGRDVVVPASLAGIIARYSSNKGALGGTIYRHFRTNTNLTDYWPCEDATGSTQAASAVSGGRAGKIFDADFGSADGINGATGCLTLNTALSSYAKFLAGTPASATGVSTTIFYFRLPGLAASEVTFATAYIGSGTVSQFRVAVGATTFNFTLVDALGATVATSGSIPFTATPLNQWLAMCLRITQSGGNVVWETEWHAVGSTIFYTHNPGGSTFVGTCGQFQRVNVLLGDAAFAGAQITHVIITHGSEEIATSDFANVSNAYDGEAFGTRVKRLADEEDIFIQWRGDLAATQTVGPQPAARLVDIFAAGLKVAGGLLSDVRDIIGLDFVTQQYLGNRRGLELDYSASHLADVPTPTADTRYLVNDFTASRDGGSSARYEADDGRRKNVNDPPTGIGRWEGNDSFAASDDDEMILIASRQVFQGTWDERRIPNVRIGLHRSEIYGTSALLTRVIATDLGDPINLTGLSASPLPPNDLLLLILGYSESITNDRWSLNENTVPAGPFQVPILDDYAGRYPRMDVDDATHSVLKSSITTTATSFVVKTDASSSRPVKVWVDSTSYPAEIGGGSTIDINIGGERITVSNIGTPTLSAGYNEQTFTISARSVNGIVKAHSALDTVKLWSPYYLGME